MAMEIIKHYHGFYQVVLNQQQKVLVVNKEHGMKKRKMQEMQNYLNNKQQWKHK